MSSCWIFSIQFKLNISKRQTASLGPQNYWNSLRLFINVATRVSLQGLSNVCKCHNCIHFDYILLFFMFCHSSSSSHQTNKIKSECHLAIKSRYIIWRHSAYIDVCMYVCLRVHIYIHIQILMLIWRNRHKWLAGCHLLLRLCLRLRLRTFALT